MTSNTIQTYYFNWLSDMVCEHRFSSKISYQRLLTRLHNIEFRYSIPIDENRALDGIGLRHRFAYEYGVDETTEAYLCGPCSVLEMMVGLALRCEESIMDDPHMGNRLGQWFWAMVTNLGLGGMSDERFDQWYVDETIERFLRRDYEPDGRGGLFTIRNCGRDLRNVEIWAQMCWYLGSIT